MNSELRLPLKASPLHRQRLLALQHAFAQVCNSLAPMVQQTRCWNRVALHHMAYRSLRAQYPEMGSQMVCNAIYSVSRASRHVYQHPASVFNVARLGPRPLPTLRFRPDAPVYFDRHTLSIKSGQVSMYTLDGRIRFELALSEEDEQRFRTDKLRELVLKSEADEFILIFSFADASAEDTAPSPVLGDGDTPEYVIVLEETLPTLAPPAQQPLPQAHLNL